MHNRKVNRYKVAVILNFFFLLITLALARSLLVTRNEAQKQFEGIKLCYWLIEVWCLRIASNIIQ